MSDADRSPRRARERQLRNGSGSPVDQQSLRSTIWKFTLDPWSGRVLMPAGAAILHVQEQANHVCVWAEVDPDAGMVERRVAVVGIGQSLPRASRTYIGTAHLVEVGDPLVLHVYDLGEATE